ncbi:MAG: uroporphyrinogen-III C-methyltransferase [Methylococcales bacterium]|nr:uroporphyrinogen-III C-methyltransferase [Methylococcales bacterium]
MAENQSTSPAPAPAPNKKLDKGFWFGLVIVLVIVSLSAMGFLLFQQLRSQQETLGGEVNKGDMQLLELTRQISSLQNQLLAIQQQMTVFESKIENQRGSMEKTLAEFTSLQTEKNQALRTDLLTRIQQVQRQLGKTRGDWLMADAEYLLSVANQRLYLMGDLKTTLEALQAADQRLRESGDPAAFKVRDAIAKEIETVRAIEPLDMVGWHARLVQLQQKVTQLDLILPYAGKPFTPATQVQDHAETEADEHELLNKAVKHLQDWVTLRHSDTDISKVLAPEEAEFIREQLRAKLELVKTALVHKQADVYAAAVTDAKTWFNENFAKNTPQGQAFQAEIRALTKLNLNRQMPDIGNSLKQLRDITKLRIEADKALSGASNPPQP